MQGDVLVKMQLAIAGPISLRRVIMQTIQHRAELLKVLKALKLMVRDCPTSRHTHGAYDARNVNLAQIESKSQLPALRMQAN